MRLMALPLSRVSHETLEPLDVRHSNGAQLLASLWHRHPPSKFTPQAGATCYGLAASRHVVIGKGRGGEVAILSGSLPLPAFQSGNLEM